LIFALHYGDMIDPVNSLLSDGEIWPSYDSPAFTTTYKTTVSS
jgi:hypothetical protein